MKSIRVDYHHEPEGWWADSPDVPEFSAAGDTLVEVRMLAREGLEFALEEHVELVEAVPWPDPASGASEAASASRGRGPASSRDRWIQPAASYSTGPWSNRPVVLRAPLPFASATATR